jgi:hypothetical protein
MIGEFYYMVPSNFFKVFFLPNFLLEKQWAFDILKPRRNEVEKESQSPVPAPSQSAETPAQSPEPITPAEAAVPQQEPIVLSKLFPDAKQDLDALFPDAQMKELLKEVQKTRQGNQRFLKRLNLSKIESEDDDPGADH